MNETRELANFITNTKYSDLSVEIVAKGKILILDQLGCELAFAVMPWSKAVYEYVRDRKGVRSESTVTHYGLKTVPEDAAFANAVFGHGFEMDDTELRTTSHPGVAVIPAAMAMGEMEMITGKELITSVVGRLRCHDTHWHGIPLYASARISYYWCPRAFWCRGTHLQNTGA